MSMRLVLFTFLQIGFVSSGAFAQQESLKLDPSTSGVTTLKPSSEDTFKVDAIVIDAGLDKGRSDLITAPGSFVVRDRKAIESTPNAKLSQVLETEPNIRFYGGPRAASQLPQIRGMQSERILILEEGVRQNYQSQHTGRVFTDFSMIENVEVVKGPWSSLYGSGAMGGVVSYRRSTAADYLRRARVNDKYHLGTEFSLDSASAGDASGQRVTVFGRANKWEPLVSFRRGTSDDVRLSTGDDLEYSANDTTDIYTSQSYALTSRQAVNVKLNRYTDEGRVPLNPSLDQTLPNQIGDSKAVKQDLIGEYQYKGEATDVHVKPFVRETEIERTRVSDGRNDIQSVQTVGIDAWTSTDKKWSENLKTTVTAGVEAFRDKNEGERNGDKLRAFPNGSSEQMGVYVQPSFLVREKWTITPGLRYDTYKNEDLSSGVDENDGEETSAKLYTSYEYQPDKEVFVGWGEAFNAPRLQDLYLTDMHFPGNFFVPNPNLKPEKSQTVEIGTKNLFRLNADNAATFDVTAFETQAEDFIARDVKATTTTFRNLDRVELRGFETALGWQGLSASAKLAYGQVRSEDLRDNQPLGDTPADHWTATLEKQIGDKWDLGTEVILTESQEKVPVPVNPGDRPVEKTGGYTVQNIYTKYRMSNGVSIQGRVNNMWDREYKPHGENIAQVGRDVRLGLSWLF